MSLSLSLFPYLFLCLPLSSLSLPLFLRVLSLLVSLCPFISVSVSISQCLPRRPHICDARKRAREREREREREGEKERERERGREGERGGGERGRETEREKDRESTCLKGHTYICVLYVPEHARTHTQLRRRHEDHTLEGAYTYSLQYIIL